MDYEEEPANEPPDELDGQLSINDYLVELGENPVSGMDWGRLTDAEIEAFLEGEANK